MKNRIVSAVLAVLAVISLCVMSAPRAAADEAARVVSWTNTSANAASTLVNLTNTTKVATTSTPFLVPPDTDVAVEVSATGIGAATDNIVVGFNKSGDQNTFTVNPSTVTPPLTCAALLNGTTANVTWFTFPKTNFVGVSAIRWDYSSNTNAAGAKINYIKYHCLSKKP